MRRRIVSGLIVLQLGLPSVLMAQAPATPLRHGVEEASQPLVEQKEPVSSSEASLRALIQRAETFFQRGETAYRQGDFMRAREEFDRAVDAILEARVNVAAHPQLLAYYRSLIERIHAYQLEAAMQGLELRQQYEPSLLEELAKIKLREEDIKAAEQETEEITLDFPVTITPEVRQFIHYFTKTPKGRATMETGLRRAGRYLEMARRIFQEEGVPLDLVWLAQAESNWRPHARSPMRAQGIWQFIAGTGAKYGLRQTSWLDERSGLEQPTRAAARYLKFLYERYLDWPLALAAYNCGEATVDRAIAASGYADFWYLHRNRLLPAETRNYVPIILAIIAIAKDPARYGFTDVEPEPALQYETVPVEGPIDLRLIAEAVGASFEHMRDLNPELKYGYVPLGETYAMRVPVGTGEQLSELLARVPPQHRDSWRIHSVAEGETLQSIAEEHRVSAEEIARVNELDANASLKAGARLIVPTPIPRRSLSRAVGVELTRLSVVRVTVRARPGDTITRIAARYGLSAREVARLNRLSPRAKLRTGQTIVLVLPSDRVKRERTSSPRTTGTIPAGNRRLTHRVRPGDTLTEIANRYAVTVSELRRWNRLSTDLLTPGQTLVIYRE
ncbi:MAG: LysM peptidoglycan-binding domain-containing protein [Blastocatellia bacterium]|nr:LysM peptidoglycan-binding domain-containing protein [Blastocatellia bacterium]MCS7157401.1 LysM peptidoglycan-binding domain-containing protein [Blastocatellia bacterium]MCX7752575.1 LysM peptidoglycan-binding domain-containing protein [Blastocatellia bacterium]MDW8168306.1 LysM peptidoglycan-binding domain-containing protein [Acidobacteriota bacterium]MDW8255502.1 LysM peptidoglycan-binding domain-containing protein [Acidobacteriota bacterium]